MEKYSPVSVFVMDPSSFLKIPLSRQINDGDYIKAYKEGVSLYKEGENSSHCLVSEDPVILNMTRFSGWMDSHVNNLPRKNVKKKNNKKNRLNLEL